MPGGRSRQLLAAAPRFRRVGLPACADYETAFVAQVRPAVTGVACANATAGIARHRPRHSGCGCSAPGLQTLWRVVRAGREDLGAHAPIFSCTTLAGHPGRSVGDSRRFFSGALCVRNRAAAPAPSSTYCGAGRGACETCERRTARQAIVSKAEAWEASVAKSTDPAGPPRLCAWHAPTGTLRIHTRPRHVRIPAAATLGGDDRSRDRKGSCAAVRLIGCRPALSWGQPST